MIDLRGDAWRRALERGLGAEVVELDGLDVAGHRLVIFRKGPLRIGYTDFVAGCPALDARYLRVVDEAARRGRVDVVRFQAATAVPGGPHYARFPLPSALIEALPAWDERQLEKPRRSANRILRSELAIRRAGSADAAAIHGLYLDTLGRHGGAARYTAEYFALIASDACWVACLGDDVVGFVAVGATGATGLYLHGGHRESARKHYPSDLLFLTMLREAKASGLERFDFLASPPGQRSLLDYKRAWGAGVRDIVVSDRPLGLAGHAFSAAYAAMAALRAR